MAESGAQPGNDNARKGRVWRDAIRKALAARAKGDQTQALSDLAEKLLAKCDDGDIPALRELGDRLEGKPAQAIIGGDDEDPPVKITGVVELVRPG